MRILGIDLGKTSVKAVELDTAFGRYEIHEYHEHKLKPGGQPEAITDAVRGLIFSLSKAPDKIVVGLRSGQATFRNLQLPTRDKKAILASVGFELEDELPYSMDDAVFDYSLLGQTGQLSHVHVSSTMNRYVQGIVDTWIQAGVDPDVITTEAWAFRGLLNRLITPPMDKNSSPEQLAAYEEPVLLLQLGHNRTTLYVHWKGTPVIAREIKWGGADLTLAICQNYSIPIEQAKSAQVDHGFVLPESQRHQATPEQIEFSNALMPAFAVLMREIRAAELASKAVTQQPIGRILLSGGTSLLPGLSKLLAEELKVSVQPLHALSSLSHSGVNYSEETDATFALAVSFALTQVGQTRTTGINLRRGEFSKQGTAREFGVEQLRGPLTAFAAVAASVMISFVVQASVYQTRLKDTNIQLEKSIKSFFGGLPPSTIRNYMNSTSTLRKQVTGELTKQRELAKLMAPNPRSPLDFLKELSATTPRDVVVDVTQFQVGAASISAPYSPTEESTASLSVLFANPQVAERFAGILSGKIGDMQRSKMEEVPGAEGGPKRWKVTFSGKPNDDSFGK